jgi:hypothetical protein
MELFDKWRIRNDVKFFNEFKFFNWLLERSRSIKFRSWRNWLGNVFNEQWHAWNSVRDGRVLRN